MPVGKGKKSPAVRGWSKLEGQINEAIIHSWEEQFPNVEGTGIILGHLIGIDIDVDQEAIVDGQLIYLRSNWMVIPWFALAMRRGQWFLPEL